MAEVVNLDALIPREDFIAPPDNTSSSAGELGKDGMHDHFKGGLGLLVTISSFLFWRLDRRNAKLIKLAEAPLKSFENSLSERSGTDVRILAKSDHPKTGAFSYFESFSQIYRSVFCLAGAGGIAVFLVAVKRLYC